MTLACRGAFAAEIIQLNPSRARWEMDRIDYGILEDANQGFIDPDKAYGLEGDHGSFYPDADYEKDRALLLLRCGYLSDTYGESKGLDGVCPPALRTTAKGAKAFAACNGLSAPFDY